MYHHIPNIHRLKGLCNLSHTNRSPTENDRTLEKSVPNNVINCSQITTDLTQPFIVNEVINAQSAAESRNAFGRGGICLNCTKNLGPTPSFAGVQPLWRVFHKRAQTRDSCVDITSGITCWDRCNGNGRCV